MGNLFKSNEHEIKVCKKSQMIGVMIVISDYVNEILVNKDNHEQYTISFELDQQGFDCMLADKNYELKERDAIIIK